MGKEQELAKGLRRALGQVHGERSGVRRILGKLTIEPSALDPLEAAIASRPELSEFDKRPLWFFGPWGGQVTHRDLATWLVRRAYRGRNANRPQRAIRDLGRYLRSTEIPILQISP